MQLHLIDLEANFSFFLQGYNKGTRSEIKPDTLVMLLRYRHMKHKERKIIHNTYKKNMEIPKKKPSFYPTFNY